MLFAFLSLNKNILTTTRTATFTRGLSSGRVLSVGWHPTLPVLFAGSSNASVRGWDLTPPQIGTYLLLFRRR